MEQDAGPDDDEPFFAYLPPEDRLWRHPSEVSAAALAGSAPPGRWPEGVRAQPDPGRPVGSGRVWGVALVAGVIGAAAASGMGILAGAFDQPTVVRSVITPGPVVSLTNDAGGGAPDWSAIDESIAPSVVRIDAMGTDGPTTASGLLLMQGGGQGYVVTDRAAISGATEMGDADGLEVTFLSGARDRATFVGDDPLSGLAVMAVASQHPALPPVGSLSEVKVADPVLALGASSVPGGSVYPGSISAESREVDVAEGPDMENLIAVSAAAVPATVAGGPLVDRFGRVIGITLDLDPVAASDQDLAFAVPVDEVEHITQQLVAGARVTHPWLGVYDMADLTSGLARADGLSGGAIVGGVDPGSPASRIGLQQSDVITSLAGTPITSSGTLSSVLDSCPPGKSTSISYLHNGKPRLATVMVSNQPAADYGYGYGFGDGGS